ncbi:phosphoglycerate mutase-like protein [Tilletiaria anomala UBC 951]|uniref:Phosphoglycerate mutase-like protein n=1 Tax=Tilletiaria anomala (strain ATCC 24038 / CBS 436.72 / UBC 951) TaxID=1037660 RepID=A0A066WAF0_TILAU|nr:phosphoglycerate mutase-like protein [Tilletiaria anomala UBC 951]KDN47750.1 phosphoglycerate mutase-like protein [Tilletiaria anomala UBC 951]
MSLAGVLTIVRHGDRMGFYQSPTSYTAKQTNLTVLGYLQEYRNGVDLRARYLDGNNKIQGIDPVKAEDAQVKVFADAGGEGTVIVDSVNALLQGLYPPFDESITLANGSVVSWGSRAQLIQVETVEPDEEVWLEGYTDCNAWQTRLNNWYASPAFKAKAAEAQPFYNSIKGILGADRPAILQNAWNIFDFLNVEFIHNATLSSQIGQQTVELARYYADYHEAGSFSDPDPKSVGNVAGTAMLAPVLATINQLSNASDPLKWSTMATAYKPFLAFGSLLGVPQLNASVVDYASSLVFEIYNNGSIQALFRNGTVNAIYQPLTLFGQSNTMVSLVMFEEALQRHSLNGLAAWCDKCSTTDARGCDILAALNGTGGAGFAPDTSTYGRHRVSPITAGLIGAFVTLGTMAILFAVLFTARRALGRKRRSAIVGHSGPTAGLELPSRTDGASIHTATSSAQHLVGDNNNI